MTYIEYGPQSKLPQGTDYSVHTNEQYGFVANLDENVKNNFSFAFPYPSGFDLSEKTTEMRAMDWGIQMLGVDITDMQQLILMLSMLDMELSDLFQDLADGDDLEWRAQFDGPIPIGRFDGYAIGTTASTDGRMVRHDGGPTLYQPRVPRVDMLTPIYGQLANASFDVVEAAETPPTLQDFDKFEETWYRMFWTLRNLTSEEKNIRHGALNWMMQNS